MTMQADYLDAQERHWNDAERLLAAQRLANADHLYGLAAECGLKRLMLAFGMPFDSNTDKPQNRCDAKHADVVWDRYESYRCGHHRGAGYSLPTTNPFADWKVSQRYTNQGKFDTVRTAPHRIGANQVRRLVKKAEREGLL